MSLFENIINHKISTITSDELLKYANQFQISITQSEASQIAAYLRSTRVNIFSDDERAKLVKEIAKIAGVNKAKEINRLFVQFTK
ncbi:DUF2624 domain-containing protein [Bacillus sp. V3B]|uniref:DUF2624 domain-containing protein n=1 Tax=Bacillus sp. V3B TaxID=2804915 RepID=UPI00210C3DF5|nr:DUF2624 domain-containing protein [Bacillus sp. V3B]MCQ6273659.1 DUF2624 domain-containing protein [Bacillus sp. V3B]